MRGEDLHRLRAQLPADLCVESRRLWHLPSGHRVEACATDQLEEELIRAVPTVPVASHAQFFGIDDTYLMRGHLGFFEWLAEDDGGSRFEHLGCFCEDHHCSLKVAEAEEIPREDEVLGLSAVIPRLGCTGDAPDGDASHRSQFPLGLLLAVLEHASCVVDQRKLAADREMREEQRQVPPHATPELGDTELRTGQEQGRGQDPLRLGQQPLVLVPVHAAGLQGKAGCSQLLVGGSRPSWVVLPAEDFASQHKLQARAAGVMPREVTEERGFQDSPVVQLLRRRLHRTDEAVAILQAVLTAGDVLHVRPPIAPGCLGLCFCRGRLGLALSLRCHHGELPTDDVLSYVELARDREGVGLEAGSIRPGLRCLLRG